MTAESGRGWRAERVITVVGLFLSTCGALLLPFVAHDRNQGEIVLGLVVFVAGYVTTMDLALRARVHQSEIRLVERMEEVEESRFGALRLQGLLAVPELEEPIADMVEAAARARSKRMQFLANRTIAKIKEDRFETMQVSQGIFVCRDRREELRLLRLALEDSLQSVKAIASLGLAKWAEGTYSDYFDVYFDFAEALDISRIFLITEAEFRDPGMMEILERHEEAGVVVYALNRERVRRELTDPAVIFDGSLLLLHSSLGGDGRVHISFTDEPVKLRDARENFGALLAIAERARPGVVLWKRGPTNSQGGQTGPASTKGSG